MPAPVMGNDAITVIQKEQHLRVPVIGRQRPTVAEDDGLSFAPIFIIDVDLSSVLLTNGAVSHGSGSFLRALLRQMVGFSDYMLLLPGLSRDFCVTFISSRSRE